MFGFGKKPPPPPPPPPPPRRSADRDEDYGEYIQQLEASTRQRIREIEAVRFPSLQGAQVVQQLKARFRRIDPGLIQKFVDDMLIYEENFYPQKYNVTTFGGEFGCLHAHAKIDEQENYLKNVDGTWAKYAELLGDLLELVAGHIPRGTADPSPFTARITPQNPRDLTQAIYGKLMRSAEVREETNPDDRSETYKMASRFFYDLLIKIFDNTRPHHIDAGWGHLKTNDKHVPDDKVLEAYFKDTPFMELFDMTIPIAFDQRARFNHTHVIAKTGRGKTTLLQNLIAHDLNGNASVIVIDPHKSIVPVLARIQLNRKVILVNPANPPGINIFDVEGSDDETYAAVIQNLTYLLRDGMTPLTGKQDDAFRGLCRLMLVFPKTRGKTATLMDMFEYLEDPAPFQKDIQALDALDRSLFADLQSKDPEYRRTSSEIKYKLRAILNHSSLRKMFTAPKTELNFRKEMDAGSLILIDADQGKLGKDFSAKFGKLFLGLIMDAARTRDPNRPNHPVFLYVDECHHFMDEQAHTLLTDARKFSVGCIFSHQDFSEIHSQPVRGALKGTGIKFAAPLADDAATLAPEMRTTKEFLLNLDEYHFAMHVSGMPSAVSVTVPNDPFSGYRQISETEYQQRAGPRPSAEDIEIDKHFPYAPPRKAEPQSTPDEESYEWKPKKK